MPALETPALQEDFTAPDFSLKSTDGKTYSLKGVKGENGLVVMFICNHCPYVKAVIDDIVRDMAQLKQRGVNAVAIMSNDVENYPEDSFENMRALAEQKRFLFPYLIDETQNVARAYGAVCTPDFYGFDKDLRLVYRGRLDSTTPGRKEANPKRELVEGMLHAVSTGKAPMGQKPSIGCSIKWRG